MKTLITSVIALLTVFPVMAEGVTFIDGSWDDARKMAAEQEKYILLDAYTDWCYWCKVQDKETFSREDVGEFVNQNFVSVKVNFEEGIGVDLAMKYRVQGYPTLLFFNPEGRLVGRIVGYNDNPSEWIEAARSMLDTDAHPPSSVDPDNLDLDYPEFFVNSFTRDGERGKPADPEVVSAWLDEQEDPYSELSFIILKMRQTNEEWDNFLIANREDYIKIYGKEEVDDKVSNIFMMKAYQAMNEGNEAGIDDAAEQAAAVVGEELGGMIRSRFKMDLYMSQGRYADYMELATPMFANEDGTLNHGMINQVCWTIYENVEDQELIGQAVEWMKKVVDTNPEYNYMDTYTALLLASGDLEAASAWAKRAIATGEANGEDTSPTQGLVEQIEAARAE